MACERGEVTRGRRSMKALRCIAACLLGTGLACGLAIVLGVNIAPARMDDGDHRLAYKLFPLLMLSLLLVLNGYAHRSRALFWIPLLAALGAALIPTTGKVTRTRYADLESAYMASMREHAGDGLDRALGAGSVTWIAVAFARNRFGRGTRKDSRSDFETGRTPSAFDLSSPGRT